ncbi:uncharacterized protein BDR25DRAFT_344013 [Lindgomyces ingoldianus]|uniref:Uncharacterized protein n=1 Tax=Lindgomyces ingoldianus TaxID=673940 RepID=A0ACB6QQC1_9PLEO|nr:uncharacterized protein BDR25DRAFT_344013 [Lindgomyces ingoldianus]KAF2468730.1 hypothetical protein BDR25DRAFT_344013 [Lindgomyces ingoldianus]
MPPTTFARDRVADPDVKYAYVATERLESADVDRHAHSDGETPLKLNAHPLSQPQRYRHGTWNALSNASNTAHGDQATTAQMIRARITATASKNSALLVTLRDTSDAPAALTQKRVHISILRDELKRQEEVIVEIEQRLLELQEQRGGTGGGMVLRQMLQNLLRLLRIKNLRDKREECLEETKMTEGRSLEEKMYYEVLGQKSRSEMRKSELLQQIEVSEKEAKEVETEAEKHEKAHEDLDALYADLFDGPTPGFPTEDAAESANHHSREFHEEMKGIVLTRRKAIRFIEQASRNWKNAGVYLKDARMQAERSVFLRLSDVKSDLANFDHYRAITGIGLEKAMLALAPIQQEIYELAKRMEDIVKRVRIEKAEALRAEKRELLEVISSAREHWTAGNEMLGQLLAAAKGEEKIARAGVRDSAHDLDERRSALQEVRQKAFEQVAGFGVAPPAYHNCCSRAEGYEQECDVVLEVEVDEERELMGSVEQ